VIFVWIIIAIVVLVGLGLAVSYNRFVSERNLIRSSFANIDTELRRRYDLIPNLVETVKGYAAHEREVFEEVARARSGAMASTGQSPAAQAAAEGPLVQALGRLFAVAENYPQLKANQNFLALQGELSNTEDRIQAARRFYNANVQNYNRRVQSFPSAFVARTFGFKEEEFFEIPAAERAVVGTAPRVDFSSGGASGAAPAAAPTTPPLAPPVDQGTVIDEPLPQTPPTPPTPPPPPRDSGGASA
jgi:LemA protein